MAGEKILIRKGETLTVKDVMSGTRRDGTDWMQVHIVDETGKVEVGAFITNPVKGLRDGDRIVVDDIEFIGKRSPNRHAFKVAKDQPWSKWERLENPQRLISETAPQLTVHLAEGGNFNSANFGDGGFGGGGFGGGSFDPDLEGDLPF